MPSFTFDSLKSAGSIAMAFALMAIIVMMILPVPSWVLDVGLSASFALAILIFTLALFAEKPLDFSAFPTVLLVSLMLRLSLNVSSTKLIIGEGHTGTNAAGNVIQSFADFVMSGNILLGLVVFGVLLIVNFTVITKGATRMAEVGARFALDGMPGKQLAIDSDLAAGAITHEEAKNRRECEQQETTFFGSLDGASKFVRGDAVAGLLITLLNLLVGLAMGVFVHNMPVTSAFETYAILTVGDGLVSQIPAVVISFASALLLARGGTKGALDTAMLSQLSRDPRALAAVGGLMGLFALVPGLPFVPFMAGALALGGLAFHIYRKERVEETESVSQPLEDVVPKSLGDTLDLDDIHIEFAEDLIGMVLDPATGLEARITNMRRHIAQKFGFIMPEIRLTDNTMLDAGHYVIYIHGVEAGVGILRPDMMLTLLPDVQDGLPIGNDVSEPVYGAPARWISHRDQEKAALRGVTVIAPTEVLATHLLEIIKNGFQKLLTLKSLRRILDEMTMLSNEERATANRRLLDELIPEKVSIDTLHSVLRLLLAERVSIRNMPVILETIAEVRGTTNLPETICELVRQRLGAQIIADLKRADGTVPLIQLAPEWEEIFASFHVEGDRSGYDIALPPELFEKLTTGLANQITESGENGISSAIITSSKRRRFITTLLAVKGITSPVLSFEELGYDARPALVGIVPA
jgi:flagellar biosynthesis protein FlhA